MKNPETIQLNSLGSCCWFGKFDEIDKCMMNKRGLLDSVTMMEQALLAFSDTLALFSIGST